MELKFFKNIDKLCIKVPKNDISRIFFFIFSEIFTSFFWVLFQKVTFWKNCFCIFLAESKTDFKDESGSPQNLVRFKSSGFGSISNICLLDAIIPFEATLKLEPSSFSDTTDIGLSLSISIVDSKLINSFLEIDP